MASVTRKRFGKALAILLTVVPAGCGPSQEERLAAARASEVRVAALREQARQNEEQARQNEERLRRQKNEKFEKIGSYKIGETTLPMFKDDGWFTEGELFLYLDLRDASEAEGTADIVLGWRQSDGMSEAGFGLALVLGGLATRDMPDALDKGSGMCFMASPIAGDATAYTLAFSSQSGECPPNVRETFSATDRADLGSVLGGKPEWLLQFRDGILRTKERL